MKITLKKSTLTEHPHSSKTVIDQLMKRQSEEAELTISQVRQVLEKSPAPEHGETEKRFKVKVLTEK